MNVCRNFIPRRKHFGISLVWNVINIKKFTLQKKKIFKTILRFEIPRMPCALVFVKYVLIAPNDCAHAQISGMSKVIFSILVLNALFSVLSVTENSDISDTSNCRPWLPIVWQSDINNCIVMLI